MVAADGRTYEKSAIERWFATSLRATGRRTSPMTNQAMQSPALTPNWLLKSQISEWQDRSNKQRIIELITAVTRAGVTTSDPKAVEEKLLELARFMGENKAVAEPGPLQVLRGMLQGSTQIWLDPVPKALQAVEVECKLVVAGLAAELRDKWRDRSRAVLAAREAANQRTQLDTEITAAKETLDKLKERRAKCVQLENWKLQEVRECGSRVAKVQQELVGYPEHSALPDDGEEGASERQTQTKSKQAVEKGQDRTAVTKRPRVPSTEIELGRRPPAAAAAGPLDNTHSSSSSTVARPHLRWASESSESPESRFGRFRAISGKSFTGGGARARRGRPRQIARKSAGGQVSQFRLTSAVDLHRAPQLSPGIVGSSDQLKRRLMCAREKARARRVKEAQRTQAHTERMARVEKPFAGLKEAWREWDDQPIGRKPQGSKFSAVVNGLRDVLTAVGAPPLHDGGSDAG